MLQMWSGVKAMKMMSLGWEAVDEAKDLTYSIMEGLFFKFL